MRWEISFNPNDPKVSLVSLGDALTIQGGQYWIAAGIQLTCFTLINGKVVVAVSFGKDFSFNLLGSLSYGITPIAYFELDFMMTADAEHFCSSPACQRTATSLTRRSSACRDSSA